jgi:hypothetical protein
MLTDQINLTQNLFEIWISCCENMKNQQDLKRSIIAFASVFTIQKNKLSPILQANLNFLMLKIVDLSCKLTQVLEKKGGDDEV